MEDLRRFLKIPDDLLGFSRAFSRISSENDPAGFFQRDFLFTDFSADDDHEVGNGLAVIDQHGFDGAIQHPHFQGSHLLAVFEEILNL